MKESTYMKSGRPYHTQL